MQGEISKRNKITETTYRALAEFRYHIRRYLSFSDRAARAAGMEPGQYQLLLAVRGLPQKLRPTVGALAEQLHIRHHSAVELIIRAERRGLVRRRRSSENATVVLVTLTPKGEEILRQVVATRLKEIRKAGPHLVSSLEKILKNRRKSRTE